MSESMLASIQDENKRQILRDLEALEFNDLSKVLLWLKRYIESGYNMDSSKDETCIILRTFEEHDLEVDFLTTAVKQGSLNSYSPKNQALKILQIALKNLKKENYISPTLTMWISDWHKRFPHYVPDPLPALAKAPHLKRL